MRVTMPADLKELRQLHEAATPGPWRAYTPDWEETAESRMSISMKSYMDDSACYRTVDLIEAYADFYPEDAEYDEAVANVQLIAAARNALPRLLDRIEALESENAELKSAIERDRTTLADFVTRLKAEMDSRFWLTEGRGSYAWNDDRYRDEFRSAAVDILAAIKPLENMAADLKNSPRDSESVRAARRNLGAENARLREALGEVAESLKCHHPPDDGSDDSCGGEDCLKCMAREALEGR